MIDKEAAIKQIINNFDFDSVIKVMSALYWHWNSKSKTLLQQLSNQVTVPTIDKLKEMVVYLLNSAYDNKSDSCSSGGFEARYIKNGDEETLSLHFIVTEVEMKL